MNLEELGIPYTDLGEQKEIELFWHISQSLASQRYLEEVLQLIVTMTASVMKSKICSLMLLDESKSELTIKATQALSSRYINKPPVKVGESVSGRAVMERRPISVKDVLQDQSYGFPAIPKFKKI
jgi:signal transduction protein with GAF and PtsI domain